ncbi:hypothetical protein NDU88_004264 [Pleurodeles waltl]|uniref:Uncharacterized protein n=1 Tax=Pleurodeles waltl TaxID=8319 RepID=A0AAV7WRD1_PLEWA|nr:hypothetical protein NDU88_004264 [Pleurodeles waltl]
MMGGKGLKAGYQLKLDKFTQPKEAAGALGTGERSMEMVTAMPGENTKSLKDIMTAIQGVRGTLEAKIKSVGIEVALMRADFHMLGARVKEVEEFLKEIKDISATLKEQLIT